MKKIIFSLFILFIVPCYTYATCDYDKHELLSKDVLNITETINYSTKNKKFDITFDNVSSDFYAIYNDKKYIPNNNSINISSLSEGTSVKVIFYANDGCENEIDIRRISIPYYNNYYKSALCDGYEDILNVCSSEFTESYVSKDLVLDTIKNYKQNRINPPAEEETQDVEEKNTILVDTLTFFQKWGFKILMCISSCVITYIIGSILYRKEVHGV